jgi:hypothetical protein
MGYVALSRVKRLENISLLGLNERALEVSPRIKILDGDFREQSLESEAYLASLGPDGAARIREEFLKKDDDIAAADDGELCYEVIDEVPVVDFE